MSARKPEGCVLILPTLSVKLFDPEEITAVLPGGLILALYDGAIDDDAIDEGVILGKEGS